MVFFFTDNSGCSMTKNTASRSIQLLLAWLAVIYLKYWNTRLSRFSVFQKKNVSDCECHFFNKMNKSITLKSYDIFTLKVVVHVYYRSLWDWFYRWWRWWRIGRPRGTRVKLSLNLSQIRLNTWGLFSRAVARERSSKFVLRVKVILASESLRVPALLKIPLATAFCM